MSPKRLVATWLLSFLAFAAVLEGYLWHHHYLLISWYVATWFVAYPAATAAFGVLAGHFAGQSFKRNRAVDAVACMIIMIVAAWAFPATLSIFLDGVALGHQCWQFVQNKIRTSP